MLTICSVRIFTTGDCFVLLGCARYRPMGILTIVIGGWKRGVVWLDEEG